MEQLQPLHTCTPLCTRTLLCSDSTCTKMYPTLSMHIVHPGLNSSSAITQQNTVPWSCCLPCAPFFGPHHKTRSTSISTYIVHGPLHAFALLCVLCTCSDEHCGRGPCCIILHCCAQFPSNYSCIMLLIPFLGTTPCKT